MVRCGRAAAVRYDTARLTKADGKGKWWEGLDPQELYTGRNIVAPTASPSKPGMSGTSEERWCVEREPTADEPGVH